MIHIIESKLETDSYIWYNIEVLYVLKTIIEQLVHITAACDMNWEPHLSEHVSVRAVVSVTEWCGVLANSAAQQWAS